MADLWRWLVSLLVWLSADPDAINAETPKASAAVAVAYAALTPEPEADPAPPKPVGPVSKPAAPANCPTGTCPLR